MPRFPRKSQNPENNPRNSEKNSPAPLANHGERSGAVFCLSVCEPPAVSVGGAFLAVAYGADPGHCGACVPVVAQPFDRLCRGIEFGVDGHDCTWWTPDQMLADEHMRRVNADLLGTLELIETGLLPVPSVAG